MGGSDKYWFSRGVHINLYQYLLGKARVFPKNKVRTCLVSNLSNSNQYSVLHDRYDNLR